MKKFLCVLLASLTVLSFAGCGGGSSKGKTDIHVWTADAGGKAEWEKLVSEFNNSTGKEKGIKIVWDTYTDLGTTLEVARKNGQLPEIATVSDVSGYSKTGDIIALQDFPGGQELIDNYSGKLVQGRNKIGDVVYNIPANSSVPGLIYNKELFKAAGIVDEAGNAKPPATWQEVREDAKKLTDTGKQIYGIAMPVKDNVVFCEYMLKPQFTATYGEMLDYDFDNITVSYDKFKYAFDWMLDIKEDGSCFPGADSLDNDTARAYFAEGKIGMFMGMSWDVGVLTSQFVAKCDWGVAPCPIVEGKQRVANWRDISGSYSICKSAQNIEPEKIIEVYKFISSVDAVSNMYEAGIRIPCTKEAVDAADKSKIPQQLVDFAEMLDEDFQYFVAPPLELEGDKWTETVTKIWAGTVSPDDAIKDLNARYTAAFKKGVSEGTIHPEWYK